MIGYEATITAIEHKRTVAARDLIRRAVNSGKLVNFDNDCRVQIIRDYNQDELLFVNCAPETLGAHNLQFPTDTDLSKVVLEITERSRFEVDIENIAKYLKPFREQGMRIAIDDFGAGWSNLPRVEALYPEFLKLDQQVVRHVHTNQQTQGIVAGMVSFCMRIGVQMIAEGIETREQDTVVKLLGVQIGQGFFYDLPKPACQLERRSVSLDKEAY